MREKQKLLLHTVYLKEEIYQDHSYDSDFSIAEFAPDPRHKTEIKLLIEFYVEGFSIRELAAKYGISEGAMKMRIKRAKLVYKKIFEE